MSRWLRRCSGGEAQNIDPCQTSRYNTVDAPVIYDVIFIEKIRHLNLFSQGCMQTIDLCILCSHYRE